MKRRERSCRYLSCYCFFFCHNLCFKLDYIPCFRSLTAGKRWKLASQLHLCVCCDEYLKTNEHMQHRLRNGQWFSPSPLRYANLLQPLLHMQQTECWTLPFKCFLFCASRTRQEIGKLWILSSLKLKVDWEAVTHQTQILYLAGRRWNRRITPPAPPIPSASARHSFLQSPLLLLLLFAVWGS